MEAEIVRDMLVGVNATLHELGCGFNPKYPRFKAYPAGSNAPGALHFGTDAERPSEFMHRQVPRWEEPHTHQDCVVFDMTVKVGGTTHDRQRLPDGAARSAGGRRKPANTAIRSSCWKVSWSNAISTSSRESGPAIG